MSYESVDRLQKALSDEVFVYAKDKKKAAGRALGTVVEIITFYMLRSWGFRDCVAIERPLSEFANPDITHNVEYSLHPVLSLERATVSPLRLPLSSTKLLKLLGTGRQAPRGELCKSNTLLSSSNVLRNACTIIEASCGPLIAHLDNVDSLGAQISFSSLHQEPYAIFECKRVGVEEGMRKGPQTIEKAKQGAYVARTVSALQKVRLRNGKVNGVIARTDGSLYSKPYGILIKEVVSSNDPDLLKGFILTVGVVSNHGNWFTSENHNKELKVLAQSYDWLLFLTDRALSEFIDQLLLKPTKDLQPARDAFLASYTGSKGANRFTKVKMDYKADAALQRYFETHQDRLDDWFNVITPVGNSLKSLRGTLGKLAKKDWRRIRGL